MASTCNTLTTTTSETSYVFNVPNNSNVPNATNTFNTNNTLDFDIENIFVVYASREQLIGGVTVGPNSYLM